MGYEDCYVAASSLPVILLFFFLDSDMGSRPESMACGKDVAPRLDPPAEAGIDSKEFIQLGPADKIMAFKV